MTALHVFIEGIGLLGPGLDGWSDSVAVLRGERPFQPDPTVVPAPGSLPAAERRRVGRVVKLALDVGWQAVRQAGVDPVCLPSVFSSSGGDGDNCHSICETLATSDRQISPTRFHNSVHNAAAGYWGIATGSTAPSNALCAYDVSFGAGLSDATTQVAVEGPRVLLVAYDAQYPIPLHIKRPIREAFGVALVIAATQGPAALASLEISLAQAPPTRMELGAFEEIRESIPAARSLPLLCGIAAGTGSVVNIEYLDDRSLEIKVQPCR